MQTFLPYPSFTRSARCLDRRRLGKQRIEANQILRVLRGETKGWANHPAVRMWRGYERALEAYRDACIREWVRRGYRNTMAMSEPGGRARSKPPLPPWVGRRAFHAAHRSNLLRKDPGHYGQFGWKEPADLEYVWPG